MFNTPALPHQHTHTHAQTHTQERYLSLAPLYYRGAHAAAVVYDITSPESFEKAKYWIGELAKNESSRPGARVCMCVVVCYVCAGSELVALTRGMWHHTRMRAAATVVLKPCMV